ncbi:hypothetical protein [Bradyrhizobium sp. JYMT SZCCT0428]|uniref:hypothetical protein n=1 Tax=Bradyrhizobium sp. JYMT SZCCT0428 TaxID=2807673 RepID=UPI001BA868EE|nr:hypothetical protein [Bradyrhizobium sp. JYMT SZCCT0428]MBR1154595.1 hypothetical protein [Bradyrhizobium sp. JYMT SZCCT0428]
MTTKLAYRINDLIKPHGPHGRSTLFKAIRERKLVAQKEGRSTIITHENYEAYLKSLPVVGSEDSSDAA